MHAGRVKINFRLNQQIVCRRFKTDIDRHCKMNISLVNIVQTTCKRGVQKMTTFNGSNLPFTSRRASAISGCRVAGHLDTRERRWREVRIYLFLCAAKRTDKLTNGVFLKSADQENELHLFVYVSVIFSDNIAITLETGLR